MRKVLAALVPALMIVALLVPRTTFAAKPTMTLTAHLSGKNEVSAKGPSHGTGMASVRIYMSKSELCYTLSVSGFKLPALAAHIHAGKAGKEGPIVVAFPKAPNKSGKANGCVMGVKSTILKAISNHPTSYYVNVHTAAYPGGAVRGQLQMGM